jgi:hypothetical protein
MPSNNTKHSSIGRRFFFRRKNRAKASVTPPPAKGQGVRSSLVDAAVVVMVIVVLAAAVPFGVTVAGEKLQAAPLGRPEQARPTAELNPPLGVMVKVSVALWPGVTVRPAALAAIVKLGAALTVSVMGAETEAAKFVSPEYCAVMVCFPTSKLLVE